MRKDILELKHQFEEGKISRRGFMRYAVLLGMSLGSAQALLAGCAPKPTPTPPPVATPEYTPVPATPAATPKPEVGETLTIAFAEGPTSLDPHFWTNFRDEEMLHIIFDTGIFDTPEGEWIPWAYESWEQIDPYTWQYKIRKGITFPNGKPLNAEALKGCFDRIKDPEILLKSRVPFNFEEAEPDEIVDEHTYNMKTGGMVPLDVMARRASEWALIEPSYYKGLSTDEAALKPMGSGPYTLVEYVHDLHLVMEAKPDYWNRVTIWGGDGTPRWTRYVMKIIPEASTRLAAVEAGEADIAHYIPIDEARSLPAVDAVDKPVRAVISETGNRMFVYIFPQPHTPELKDKRVRLALQRAVEWESINQQLFAGVSTRLPALMSPTNPLFNPNVKIPYEPDKAKALLEEAGVPEGYTLRLVTADVPPEMSILAQALAAQFKEVGLNVEVEIQEGSITGKQSRERGCPFDLVLWNFGGAFEDPKGSLGQMMKDYWGNQTGWDNPEWYELWDKLDTEEALDPEERRKITWRLQEILVEDPPFIGLGAGVGATALGPRVNYTLRPDLVVLPWEVTLLS